MTMLHTAIGHLEQGDWEAAHQIVQDDPSELGSWAHGVVHLMEGDLSNARYWYRKARRALPTRFDIAAEIEALRTAAG